MKTSQRELEELEVLERIAGYHGSPTLRGRRPNPKNYMGLLRFSVEETPKHAAAAQRLIDRGILVIVRSRDVWVLATVGSRASKEMERLRAKTTDPLVYLKQLIGQLQQVRAGIHEGAQDPETLIEQGEEILGRAITVAQGIERSSRKG